MRLFLETSPHRRTNSGVSLIEVLIAMSVGSLVLAAVSSLTMYAAKSTAAMVNYTDLDSKSRYALDVISREIRQASAVLAIQTNLPVKTLTLTNAAQAAAITLTYDSNARTVVMSKTGEADLTALTECDRWDFSLYQRTPYITPTNILYYPATNTAGVLTVSTCKLINLSWRCSRAIFAQKVNTESVQAAQIVLRSKQ
jgi:prepilin-type N-terminal cleavage/methylation domain-containing protein